jgi:hypothetical protein
MSLNNYNKIKINFFLWYIIINRERHREQKQQEINARTKKKEKSLNKMKK